MAIGRLNVLRVDVFGQRKLTLEPSIADLADNRLMRRLGTPDSSVITR
jgi:hypothetical protein